MRKASKKKIQEDSDSDEEVYKKPVPVKRSSKNPLGDGSSDEEDDDDEVIQKPVVKKAKKQDKKPKPSRKVVKKVFVGDSSSDEYGNWQD